jgi:hypothetical protein
MTFLIIICYLLAVILACTACAVVTHMLEIAFESESDGFLPALMALLGVFIGLLILLPLHLMGVPFWLSPLLCPLATLVSLALLAAIGHGVGYITVHAGRFLAQHSRNAGLAIREKLRDYRFHRNLDQ